MISMKQSYLTFGILILATGITALALAACGGDVKSMEYGELQHLSRNDREEILNGLKDEEKAAIMLAGMKYAFSGDTVAINHKTLGELIEEGTEIAAQRREQSK